MPESENTDGNYIRTSIYVDQDFKSVLQAFDILSKHNSIVLNSNQKLSKKMNTNGCRSQMLRFLIMNFVQKHLEDTNNKGIRIFNDDNIELIRKRLNLQKQKYLSKEIIEKIIKENTHGNTNSN